MEVTLASLLDKQGDLICEHVPSTNVWTPSNLINTKCEKIVSTSINSNAYMEYNVLKTC
jgi:hypothetical protein